MNQRLSSSRSRLRKLRTLVLAALALGLVAPGAPGPSGLIGALLAADPGYQVVERGLDYAVYQRVSAVTNAASGVTLKTPVHGAGELPQLLRERPVERERGRDRTTSRW